jgi:hypothetical protein
MRSMITVLLVLGCGGERQPAGSTGSGSAAPTSPDKWACAADTDCMNSCSQGAVNAAWYAAAKPDECEDGCSNQLSVAPKCIDRSCVAFSSDPHDSKIVTRNDFCTKKR